MNNDPMAAWLAGFTSPLTFDPWADDPENGGDGGLLAVLTGAVARFLPEGDDPALHVAAEVRSEPGRLAVSLRGLTPAGFAAVDALSEGDLGDGDT